MTTIRLTAAQAMVRFLSAQRVEIDGRKQRLFEGVFAIFGHGNVAGIGEALFAARDSLPTYRAHNEQAMAHAAIAFAKASRRRRMMACTTLPHGQRVCGRTDDLRRTGGRVVRRPHRRPRRGRAHGGSVFALVRSLARFRAQG
jgi:hypothetical protein